MSFLLVYFFGGRSNRRKTVVDALNHTTTYGYDANGNRISITDANNKPTTYTYDERNQLETVTDSLNGLVSYSYDDNGNRIGMLDANNHNTTYTYDELNRLQTVTDPLNFVVTYGYDEVGNRTSQTKADSDIINYSYDALDRLTIITTPGSTIEYAYDPVGNRQVMTDTLGVTNYDYDALDRITQVISPVPLYPSGDLDRDCDVDALDQAILQTAIGSIPGDGNWNPAADLNEDDVVDIFDNNLLTANFGQICTAGTLDYTYDDVGNRLTMSAPGSKTVTYVYDLNNRLETVSDWDGRVTTYSYDDAGRQTGITFPNSVEASYSYDDADRLTDLLHEHPSNGIIASFVYTLDDGGNRETMTDWEGVTSYDYDDLYRLTEVTYPNNDVVEYAYDPMGNREVMTDTLGVTIYTYDIGDRLLSAGSTNFTWDDNGNMTGKGTATYIWDALDRLIQVTDGGTAVSFAYDGDGTRLGKTVNALTTNYLQDVVAPLPLVVVESTRGRSHNFVYGNDLITLLDSSAIPSFYHTDGLGSTRALSDAAGMGTDLYSYDVFGSQRSHTGISDQDFTFSGEQEDKDTGLLFLRARYYDPSIGRFTAKDLYPALAIYPQSLHRYVYVENNPVNMDDPTGNAWYDMLDANQNGINDWVKKHILRRTPVVGDLLEGGEGMGKWASARRENPELINSSMTDEDYDKFLENERIQMEGLEQGLTGFNNAIMSAPGTSINPSYGLTSFLPKPLNDVFSFFKSPWKWGVGKSRKFLFSPITGLPNALLKHNFQIYRDANGRVLRINNSYGYGGGGGGSWGIPPGEIK